MAPVLTQHDELRRRILSVLAATETGSLGATEAADTIFEQYTWTADDHRPFPASEGMPKWRKRLQIQRSRMATDGLVERSSDHVWTLTSAGWNEARNMRSNDETDIRQERERRERLWQDLHDKGGPKDVTKRLVRELNLYGGQPGIFVHQAETRTAAHPHGIAVTFLNAGTTYEDDLTETGLIYHYPSTDRPGRHDANEIEAARAAYHHGLPVFVAAPGSSSRLRTVYRGYIEDMDDAHKVLLVTFTDEALPPPPDPKELTDFSLTDEDDDPTYSPRKNRPNQARFAYQVIKRYGEACAVCGLDVPGLVQAAHLVSKKNKGSDDPRNGLPLCANHHLAFDKKYWTLDPDTNLHTKETGPTPAGLGITRSNLGHLSRQPHAAALATIWANWKDAEA